MRVTFVSGNEHKVAYLGRMLGIPLDHQALDIEEIQSVSIREVALAKAKVAFEHIGSSVLVEDVGLHFTALGKLPGAFTKWFELELGHEKMCRLLDPFGDRSAFAEVSYCLYDGKVPRFFAGTVPGSVPEHPRGDGGFGFDPIFIHEGHKLTRAELSEEERDTISPRSIAIADLRKFLHQVT